MAIIGTGICIGENLLLSIGLVGIFLYWLNLNFWEYVHFHSKVCIVNVQTFCDMEIDVTSKVS